MALEDLEKFERIVLTDIGLQEKLRDIESKTEIAREMVALGGHLGLEFTVEEVGEAIQAGYRDWLERWI